MTHARTTLEHEDYIATHFYANSANAVMETDAQQPRRMRVTLDGAPIDREIAGRDVEFSEDGDSYVLVGPARLYQLVEKPYFSGHELRLSPLAEGVSLYTFTFGAYPQGP